MHSCWEVWQCKFGRRVVASMLPVCCCKACYQVVVVVGACYQVVVDVGVCCQVVVATSVGYPVVVVSCCYLQFFSSSISSVCEYLGC